MLYLNPFFLEEKSNFIFLLWYANTLNINSEGDQLRYGVLRTCHYRAMTAFCMLLFPYNYVLTQKDEYDPLSIQYTTGSSHRCPLCFHYLVCNKNPTF